MDRSRWKSLARGSAWILLGIVSGGAYAAPERVDELIRQTLSLDASPDRGAVLYRQYCRGCHGDAGYGNSGTLIPAIAAQRYSYLVKQFADIAERERDAPEMHRVIGAKPLNDPQAWADLAVYVSGLAPTGVPETGDGTYVSLGEAMYREGCASCHEEDARGDDDGFVPSLRNQHYSYLLQQMRGLAVGHRLNVEPDLVRFIDSLDIDEITGLADYLSRMRGPVRDRSRLRDDGTVVD